MAAADMDADCKGKGLGPAPQAKLRAWWQAYGFYKDAKEGDPR